MPNIIEITDLSAPELAVYTRLTEAQLRNRLHPEDGLFIAESPKVIGYALDAGYEPVSLLTERRHIAGKAAALIARLGNLPVYTAHSAALQQLTGYPLTRGVLCAMRRRPLPGVEALCGDARRVAVLENIVDATNLGAIFRSAAALGVDAVLLTPSCCDPLNRRAVRVSMGTVFQAPWTWIGEAPGDWPGAGLARLSALGYKSVALALSDRSIPIDDDILKAQAKLALVVGTEGDGLSPETVARCDFTARIPMAHGVDSLNVAAAGAVAFWELCR
ncbi:MAG: RNA methyltransferase [Clostridia bacterium]|nr:RNA methyltransferase [Clostridia bacterium]